MTERDIFLEALEKTSPEERQTFLDRSCGTDTQLRSRLERLLMSHDEGNSLLDHPILGDGPAVPLTEADRSLTRIEPGSLRLDFLTPSEKPGCLGILGQYEILEVVAHGGMGIVLKGHDTKLNRIVAIKVLSPDIASIPTAHKRFLREARAAAAVSHDHIVTIYAVEEQPVPHLAMEYIDGCTLQQKIDKEGELELKEVLRIGRQIASALVAAHEQGLVHRDIKPGNILLQNSVQRVQITDFGIARATADVDITRAGEVTGTPQYMSPEQAKSQPVDHRSDLFSLGSVLYAMCVGRSPFRAETPLAVIKRVCDDKPRPLRENSPEIPEWFAAIIEKLLSKDRDDRFQSAAEVADLLGRHLAHLQDPGATSFPGVLQIARPEKERPAHRRWLTAAVVLVIALAGFGFAEATGVTNLAATVIRIATGQGTLVIEVDDPTVQLSLDGEELSITGAGIQELTLRPGQYQLRATKEGKPVKQELVTVSRGGRQVVHVGLEFSMNAAQGREDGADYMSKPEGAITEVDRLMSANAIAANELAFSHDGTELLCARITHKLEIWDLETHQCSVVKNSGNRVVASPTSHLAATAAYEKDRVTVWDLDSLRRIRECVSRGPSSDRGFVKVSLSANARRVAAAGYDDVARVWDVESGEEIQRFKCDGKCLVAQLSPDGQRVLVGFQALRMMNVETGEEIWQAGVKGHIAVHSPCGRWVIVAHGSTIILCNAETGEISHRFEGHKTTVGSLRFIPGSRYFLSGARDGTMRLWSIATGRELARVTTDTYATIKVAVSPDGRYAASGGGGFVTPSGEYESDGDYAIRVWQLPESVWPEESVIAERERSAEAEGAGNKKPQSNSDPKK